MRGTPLAQLEERVTESATIAAPQAEVGAGRGRSSLPAVLVVWGVWFAMAAADVWLVARYGSNVPSWDEWDMVPTLTHEQPVTGEWLWSQHNEHRVPLPRLVFLVLHRIFGIDFRVTMYFNTLVMAALAAASIVAATRLRGRLSYSDVFFPLTLLNWGQAVNLLWGWQLQFFTSVLLAMIALLAMGLAGTGVSLSTAGLVVGVMALLLPLSGASGVALVPALALWPLYLAWSLRRTTSAAARRVVLPLAALGVGAFGLLAVYFVGWEPVPYHPKSDSVVETVETALKFLTIGLGPVTRDVWPFSGLVAIAFFGLTGLRLVSMGRYEGTEGGRATGLLLFGAGMVMLGVGLGLGRNGFEPRYITLAVPVWCGAYLAWTFYGSRSGGVNIPALLAAASALALGPNSRAGLEYARDLRAHLGAFERDMVAGVPARSLIARYGDYLHPHHDIPDEYLPMLRRTRVGPYPTLQDGPALQEIPVALVPSQMEQLQWRDGEANVAGPRPWIEFDLGRELRVEGIRLKYRYRGQDGTLPYISLHWKRRAEAKYPLGQFRKYSPTGDRANWERGTWTRLGQSETTMTVWVSDDIGQVGITPGFRPAVFRIVELVVLVPAEP